MQQLDQNDTVEKAFVNAFIDSAKGGLITHWLRVHYMNFNKCAPRVSQMYLIGCPLVY